ncbi:MAG: Gfo/Idh/MocA family oxidoreductase [Candidatus Brocadiaceae bacterium]|nr:Gfo/Idh/MocA family oxidoreductase [Candidatus Brocadiaceae bacterium]
MEGNTNIKLLNILVIGTGMYVCGRGTDGYGTILPAIYEWARSGSLGDIYVAGTHIEGINTVKGKFEKLNRLFGFDITPKYFPESDTYNPDAYKVAMCEIPRPACAIVVVPDHLHRDIAGDTVGNNIHTLVVKPLAPTVKEVNELIELQGKCGVYCTVEFHKRLDRSNLKLRDTVASGKIGDPLYFIVEYSQRKGIPEKKFKSWVEDTNIFQYLGIHYVDIIYFVTGAIPRRVMAIGQKNYLSSRGIDNYDSIQVVVEWVMPSGALFSSVILTNWIDPESSSAMSNQRIKVIGTKGRYEADQKKRGICVTSDKEGVEEPNPDFCSMYGSQDGDISFQGYGIDSITRFLNDVTMIENEQLKVEELDSKRPTFKESIVPTVIIEAVNRSIAEDGRWVNTVFEDSCFSRFE